MNQSGKLIVTSAILLAAVGCAGEEESQSAPGPASAAAPAGPPAAVVDAARAKMPTATQPPASVVTRAANSEQKAAGGPKIEGPKVETDHAGAGTGSFTADELAAIKELPEADQQIAMKQVSCPVSGEPLGSMGKPFKATAEGRSFFLCCKGCEKNVKADPKGVLAKLDQKRP
jgi:hypothetical protein